ncbi:polysaccharide pyruvyl transferase family protein [Streptomyces polyrhachis]|uniref:Polysaccharide pyruvyl transferase family protein n=1 Tax=Streptomyces polyrhachis TaxID=1282885 RepID=A0ABW2GJF5_9ACTN
MTPPAQHPVQHAVQHDTRHPAPPRKRRTAFVCRVHAPQGYETLPALLRSLALSNPAVCEDFLVLHAGAPPALDAARPLHPRLHSRPLDADLSGYDTLVELEAHWTLAPELAVQRTPAPAPPLADTDFRAAYFRLKGAKHPELTVHLGLPLLTERPSVDLARTVALALREQGRYEEAVEALSGVLERAGADQPRFHETLGSLLVAVSRYAEAETHLLLATASPEVAPKAFSQLARLAWLRGEEAAAREYAADGLDAEPVNRACRAYFTGEAGGGHPPEEPEHPSPGEQFAHAALYATGQENAGDKLLPEAVRLCVHPDSAPDTGPARWHPVPVHRLFDERALAEVNARRGLVVGGGGLFLPDTMPNGHSAWQWNIPDALLERITVPLAVFAVGYNVFDGQGVFEQDGAPRRARFRRSLATLTERAAFFGLRNHGSVEKVRELLPPHLREKVRYQPCPTTVFRKLLPDWSDPGSGERTDTVHINCAYDRATLRFGQGYGHFLAEMAKAVRALGGLAEVRCAPHTPADERFVHDLRREHGIALPVDPLYDRSNTEVRALFRRTKLVIGMRGHAGMIPFGCGTPILSLVSHPKLGYFLSDIDRPEWGISVHEPRLGALLAERAGALLADHAAAVADVHDRQELLWRLTRENLGALHRDFGPTAPAGAVPGPRLTAEAAPGPAARRPASATGV